MRTPPRGVIPEPSLDETAYQAYSALADKLGYHPAALVYESVCAELHTRGLPLYPYADVKAYLDHCWGCLIPYKISHNFYQQTWGWTPLRERDLAELHPNYRRMQSDAASVDNGTFYWDRTYDLAVPLPILLLVEALVEKIPGLYFAVSDRRTGTDRTGDPFLLAVAPDQQQRWIVAEWDEPHFRAVQRAAK